MEWNRCLCVSSAIILSFLLMGFSVSSSSPSTFISDSIFGSHASSGRNLLQARKACTVNFEFLNYTIITSKCKGPQYLAVPCCAAFLEFACPYADVLNDLTNDCASTMFSYINLYGRYPAGLFASECRGGKEGLECPAIPPSVSASDNSSGIQIGIQIKSYPYPLLMLTAASLLLLFKSL
ncbi:GPI-anchored protein LLG1 [Corylus avellana]|uniref:GPI-anchored protein LLG1 n=1 Tax=Corylus avellana TaxID=13451 RepID=UPI00286A4720|nr:GPI-anchored protein LLG1 [Corylus avellana]